MVMGAVDKPGPVADDHFSTDWRYHQPSSARFAGLGCGSHPALARIPDIWACSRWGFQCGSPRGSPGGLLLHHFTLTATIRIAEAVYFLLYYPYLPITEDGCI